MSKSALGSGARLLADCRGGRELSGGLLLGPALVVHDREGYCALYEEPAANRAGARLGSHSVSFGFAQRNAQLEDGINGDGSLQKYRSAGGHVTTYHSSIIGMDHGNGPQPSLCSHKTDPGE